MNTFKILDNVKDVNSFMEVEDFVVPEDRPLTLTLRLSKNGLRYIPAALSTLEVKFTHIDSGKTFTRLASVPFVDDRSIWSVPLLQGDVIANNVEAKLTLSGGATMKFYSETVIGSTPDGAGFFC